MYVLYNKVNMYIVHVYLIYHNLTSLVAAKRIICISVIDVNRYFLRTMHAAGCFKIIKRNRFSFSSRLGTSKRMRLYALGSYVRIYLRCQKYDMA